MKTVPLCKLKYLILSIYKHQRAKILRNMHCSMHDELINSNLMLMDITTVFNHISN
jgi:hypothetical protein